MKPNIERQRLGDLFTFKNGRAFKKEEWSTTGLPIIRIQNLNSKDAPFNYFAGEFSESILVESGDLLFSWSGTVGSSFGSHIWNGEEGVLNQHIFKIGLRDTISKRYAFHGLRYITAEIEQSVNGAVGLVHITKEKLNEFTLPVPSLPEQERIAALLDEAFEGIATAKANAERNLHSASALFKSGFDRIVSQREYAGWRKTTVAKLAALRKGAIRTGPFGSQLLHSEFVDEGIAVLGIDNAVANEFRWGKSRFITPEKYKRLERYRVHPGDVLITIMGTCGRCAVVPDNVPTAINTKHLCCITLDRQKCLPEYLHAYFLHHHLAQEFLAKHAKGAIMAGLNMGLIEELPVWLPPVEQQREMVVILKSLGEETQRLASTYERKLIALEVLRASLLHQAFSGELTRRSRQSAVVPLPTTISGITTTDLHAGILATAYDLHEKSNLQKYFGHVKAEKIAHMVEAHLGIDLARTPIKDAAGPNDYPHLLKVEHRARKAGYFNFERTPSGGYRVKKLRQFDRLLARTCEGLGERKHAVEQLLELMLPMTTQQAEICATVYAAWNNLLLDGQKPTDDEIVFESRENWHSAKLNIPREKFFAAIEWLREKDVVASGRGNKVSAKSGKK